MFSSSRVHQVLGRLAALQPHYLTIMYNPLIFKGKHKLVNEARRQETQVNATEAPQPGKGGAAPERHPPRSDCINTQLSREILPQFFSLLSFSSVCG